jgi:hypothetical protein
MTPLKGETAIAIWREAQVLRGEKREREKGKKW